MQVHGKKICGQIEDRFIACTAVGGLKVPEMAIGTAAELSTVSARPAKNPGGFYRSGKRGERVLFPLPV